MNFNKVILCGNLTRDTQLSYTPNQTAVCEFGIAVNRKWKSSSGDEQQETLFIECVMFGKRAEALTKYVLKGDPLFIEGRLKFDQWTQDDGVKRSKIRVVVENFEFMGEAKSEEPKKSERQENEQDEDDVPW